MENGVHMAMPYDVHVIFGVFVPLGIDHGRVYPTYTRGGMEFGLKCKRM